MESPELSSRPAPFGPVVSLVKSPALVTRFALSKVVAPPIGLAYLAGTLEANGIETQIVDAVGAAPDQLRPLDFANAYAIGLDREEVVRAIDERADIIGVSCMFSSSWPNDWRLIKSIRERFPKAWIVLGGEHTTACTDYILETCKEVDICAQGEGEETLLELVNVLRSGGDLSVVAGIAYRDGDAIHRTPRRSRIGKLDEIPRPAWDLVPLENYMQRGLGHGMANARNMPLMATRGCPYECTFCSSPQMWTTKWSARDPLQVVEEMKLYIEKYRAENFDLYDLTAIIRKEWIVAFAGELIRQRLNVTWQLPSGTRSEAIDAEVADLLMRSGCKHMYYAPESGSPETLKRIKKRVKLPNLEKSLRDVVRRRMKVICNVLLFPDDTVRDVVNTFRFMLRCAWLGLHDISFVPFVPYPGTELYEQLVNDGRVQPMSEEYFVSLLTHSDLSKVNSYNPRFSVRQVKWLRTFYLGTFYAVSYLRRPYRPFRNLFNVIRNRPETRLEVTVRSLAVRQLRILFGS